MTGRCFSSPRSQAVINIARPQRGRTVKYRAFVIHPDDKFEMSPRISYADAVAFAQDRDAIIIADEKQTRDEAEAESGRL